MSEQPIEVRRLIIAWERILKGINDALNKPPSEIALLAELQAQLLVARKVAADQGLSERDALIQAASAATSFSQLEEQIAVEERAPAAVGAALPQREPYTLEDAKAVLADSRLMAQQLFFERTGEQPDAATALAIDTYVITNLLTELGQRGVPTNAAEEIGEQIVSTQGEAITRFPGSVTPTQRLSDQLAALRDSDNPNSQISPELYRALAFPETPLDQVPARFRARVPVSGAAQREVELKALDVVQILISNNLANLQKVIDIAGGPTGVTNYGEAFARVASNQTEEEVEAGTNTLPSADSPSEIRAERRATKALGALADETSTKKAVEDIVGSPGLETDPVKQKNKTQAVRRVTDTIQTARRAFLENNPGATKEEIDAHLAPILARETTPEVFDRILSEVAQEVGLLKFNDLESITKELRAILGRAGHDAGELEDETYTQIAQIVLQSDDPSETAQRIVPAFPLLVQQTEREEFATLSGAEKRVADILDEAGLDADEILPERLTQIAQQAVRAGGINEQGFVDAFPMFARESAAQTFVEGGADAITERLEQAAGFRIPDFPGREEALERLSDTIRFQVQRDPFTDIDRLLQGVFRSAQPEGGRGFRALPEDTRLDRLQGIDEEDVGALGATRAEERLEGANPLLRTVFEGLQFEPTGGGLISPQDAALITGSPGARQRFDATPPALEGLPLFGNVRRAEPPIGFGDLTPALREAAGGDLAFLSFLFQPEQFQELQAGFGEARRGQVRAERARFQTIGEDLSEAQQALRTSFRTIGGADVRGRPGGEFFDAERERLQGRIRTASQFQSLASPTLDVPEFVQSQIGGLRRRFDATPGATAARRRLLSGGRTTFRRRDR